MLYQLQARKARKDRQDAILLTIHGGSMKRSYSVVIKSKVPCQQTDLAQARFLMQKRPLDGGIGEPRNARAARAFVFALLLGLGSVLGWSQQSDQQQMRGLDEQVQEIKSDVLSIAQELSRLEEKLLYPSGTEVAVFIVLAKGDPVRIDAVRLQIDGQLVAHYIYSFKELEALRKGGVQRVYVGNVAAGDHQLEVLVDGKLQGGADFSRTGQFAFRKDVKPKLMGLTLAGAGNAPIALKDW